MSAHWKTVRVFISSTFRDMQAERDWLVKRVFPALRQRLEPHRIHLIDIDLRWGITRQQADNDQVLGLCLQQIDECRPFFLGLLGGRYGWVPSKFPVEVGTRYGWTQAHTGKSVTELEILHGVLNDQAMQGRALFCLRAEDFLRDIEDKENRRVYLEGPTDEELHKFGRQVAEHRAAVHRQQLANLKNGIRALSPPMPLFDGYPCTWDPAAVDPATKQPGRVGGLARLGNWILDRLERAILDAEDLREHFAGVRSEVRDELAEERDFHKRFIESRTRVYIGRQKLQDDLKTFVTGAEANPCLVTGPSGSGKSAALAKFVSVWRDQHPQEIVIAHFVGASPRSTNLREMMRHLCAELKAALNLDDEIKQDIRELSDQFRAFLDRVPAKRRVLLMVDALNQFDETDNAHALYWLPSRIPLPVRLIVSCIDDPDRPDQPTLVAMRRWTPHVIKVGLLTDERLGIVREIPSMAAKTLDETQVRLLLANEATRNPLFLLVALEELRGFGSFEELNRKIAGLPQEGDTLTAIFQQVIRRLGEDFNTATVKEVLTLLACARRGLSERELLDLIEGDNVRIEESAGDLFPILRQLRPYLQTRGPLLDFYHRHLAKATHEEFFQKGIKKLEVISTNDSKKRAHFALVKYFERRWREPYVRATVELPYQQTCAELWDALQDTLTNLQFLEIKTQAGLAFDLILDCERATETQPYPVFGYVRQAVQAAIQGISQRPECAAPLLFNKLRWTAPGDPELHRRLVAARKHLDQKSYWIEAISPPDQSQTSKQCSIEYPSFVKAQAVLHDQSAICLVDFDNRMEIRRIRNGELLVSQKLSAPDILTCAINDSATRIVTSDKTGLIRVEGTTAVLKGRPRDQQLAVLSSNLVLAATSDHRLVAWDSDCGRQNLLFENLPHPVLEIRVRGNGRHAIVLAGQGQQQRIVLLDLEGAEYKATQLPELAAAACCVDISADGNVIAVGALDRCLRILSRSGSVKACIPYQTRRDAVVNGIPTRCALGCGEQAGAVFLTTSDGFLSRWDYVSGRFERWQSFHSPIRAENVGLLESLPGDGDAFIGLASKCWSVHEPSLTPRIVSHKAAPSSSVITANSEVVSFCQSDRSLCFDSTIDGSTLCPMVQFRELSALALLPDLTTVVAGDRAGNIATINPRTGAAKLLVARALREPVVSLCSGRSGTVFAAGVSGTIIQVDTTSGECTVFRKGSSMQMLRSITPSQGRGSIWVIRDEIQRQGTGHIVVLLHDKEREDVVFASDRKLVLDLAVCGDMVSVASTSFKLIVYMGEAWVTRSERQTEVSIAAFLANGLLIAAVRPGDKWIEIWRVNPQLETVAAMKLDSPASCFSSLGHTFAVGCQSGKVSIFNLRGKFA